VAAHTRRLEALWRDIVSQAVEIGSRAPEMAPDEIDALGEEAHAATRGSRGKPYTEPSTILLPGLEANSASYTSSIHVSGSSRIG